MLPDEQHPTLQKKSTENRLYTLEIPFIALFVICFVDLCLHGMHTLVVDDDGPNYAALNSGARQTLV